MRVQVLFERVHIHGLQGQWQESETAIRQIEDMAETDGDLAKCQVYRAFNLFGQEQPQKALSMLMQVSQAFPTHAGMSIFAWIKASNIHCSLGNTAEAGKILQNAEASFPRYPSLQPPGQSLNWYVVFLCEEDFGKAAELQLRVGQAEKGQNRILAEALLKAGILMRLDNRPADARKIWGNLVKRFPVKKCAYFADLAKALARKNGPSSALLEKMPYNPMLRSEVFYLIGLLMEKRGDAKLARSVFEMSWKEDLTLRWPSYLSRQQLRKNEGAGHRGPQRNR